MEPKKILNKYIKITKIYHSKRKLYYKIICDG